MKSFTEYTSLLEQEMETVELSLEDLAEGLLDEISEEELVSFIEEELTDLEEGLLPNEKRMTVQVGPNQKKVVVVDKNSGRVTRGALKGKRFDVNRAAKKAAMRKMATAEKTALRKEENKEIRKDRSATVHKIRADQAHVAAQHSGSYRDGAKEKAKKALEKAKMKNAKWRENLTHDDDEDEVSRDRVRLSKSKDVKDRLQAYKERKKRDAETAENKADAKKDLATAKKNLK